MFGSEIKKIFTGKFILVLLSLCVLNVLLIYYNEIRTTPYHGEGGYKETWEQIEKELETSDILTVYEREKQEADENIFSGLIKAAAVKKQIGNELEGIIGYTDYLRNMRETAELTGSISIFRDNESGYSVRNREKTIRAYEKMESVTVQPSPSLGIELFAASTLTDFMALILIIYAVFSIWIKDQEEGMQNLLRSCFRGRKSLVAVKAAAGVFVCLVIELLLYGGTLLISWKLYGLGDLTRFLPSVSMFRQTAWPVRVWEFLILFFIVKLSAYSMCMLLFGFFAGKVHTSTATILVSGIVIGGSCLTYGQISGDSYAGIFKYLLPYGLLQTQEVFRIYRNLNLFEYPVNLAAAYGVVLVFGIAVLVFFLLKGADQKKSRVSRHKISVLKRRRTKRGHHRLDECGGVLLNELRKLLIDRKVLLILVVLGLLQGYLYKGEAVRYYNYTEYCYRQYLDVLSGELTPEKEAYIEREKDRFAELLNEQDQTAAGLGSDLEKQLQAYEAFCRVQDYCDYLHENHLTYMVYEPAYEELTASAGNGKDAFLAFEMMAFMVLCATQIYGPDDQLHMSRLCRMTLYGRKRAEMIRVGISACIGGAVLFLNFGGFIVCFLSEKLKSVMNTVMLGFLLLALPFGVLMLAEAAAPFLLLYSPLLGNYLMKLPVFATVGIPALILIVMWECSAEELLSEGCDHTGGLASGARGEMTKEEIEEIFIK